MRSILASFLLFPLVCWGAEPSPPRTIDMTQPLMADGKPIPDPSTAVKNPKTGEMECPGGECPPLTLGAMIKRALFATFPEDQNLDGSQKWARGVLAMRIADDHAATLTAEETALIKRLIGHFPAQLVFVVYPLIDPAAKPPEVK